VLAADIAGTNAFDTIADTLTGLTPEHHAVQLRLEQ
jgi:hypothetical protein